MENASAQDHFLAGAVDFFLPGMRADHAHGAAPFKQEAGRLGACHHQQVAAMADMRVQIGPCGAPALTIPLRDLVNADAFLFGAVSRARERLCR